MKKNIQSFRPDHNTKIRMNRSTKIQLFIFAFMACTLFFSWTLKAQERNAVDLSEEELAKPLTFRLDREDEEAKKLTKRKVKKKKKMFYGIKTRKGFARSGNYNNEILELFYLLKTKEVPDKYVRNIHYYDKQKRKVVVTRKYQTNMGYLLHGPYKKMKNGEIIEQGIYYKGTKHGRWETYGKDNILTSKHKYFRGWPKESLVKYYDREQTILKEIIPIEYGRKEGYYYYFYKNGNVAMNGEYASGERVGIWREYYANRRRKKKEIQYSKIPFDKKNPPRLMKEWNKRGKLIYDRKKFLATQNNS